MGKMKKKSDKNVRGFVNILFVGLIIALAIVLSGSLIPSDSFPKNTGAPLSAGSALACCDSGSGDSCTPSQSQTFSYNGQTYGLLRSGVKFQEGNCHLQDSGQKDATGDPIIVNTSDKFASWLDSVLPGGTGNEECGHGTQDQIYGSSNPGDCVAIPHGELIYVCRQNCTPTDPSYCKLASRDGPNVTEYGNEQSIYDVYFNTSFFPNPGIPDVIKNCVLPSTAGTPSPSPAGPTIVFNQQPGKENLQLYTFDLIQPTPASGTIPFLSPYCKPAVYLYPQHTSLISVKLNLSEPLTYSDPTYPASGWSVIADPTGLISYRNKPYDYLYYETKVPDSKVEKPKNGYVVTKDELSGLFSKILPKLGLNSHEAKQFSDYWIKALPASPYFFVGIVPQASLNNLTSLNILPTPATEIRVTLYFEELDQKINVDPPTISTPTRKGFTVVEWGGIFKKHKDTNFTCIM